MLRCSNSFSYICALSGNLPLGLGPIMFGDSLTNAARACLKIAWEFFTGGVILTNQELDPEGASVGGYWLGIGSFVVGIASLGLAIYSTFSSDKNALLIAMSGWSAAILVGGAGWVTTDKLLRHASALSRAANISQQELVRAQAENAACRSEYDRLLAISEYLVTKTVRKAASRSVPPAIAEEKENEDGE